MISFLQTTSTIDQKQNDHLIEIDTSGSPGFQFSFNFPVRTPEMINAFVHCEPDTKLESELTTNSFLLGDEETCLDWYICAYPNGYTCCWEDSSSLFVVSSVIPQLKCQKNENNIFKNHTSY